MKSIGVIGCGVWGTSLAIVISKNILNLKQFENKVGMWVFEVLVNKRKLSGVINKDRENIKYLPGVFIPENIYAEPNLVKLVMESDILFFAVPQKYSQNVINSIKKVIKPNTIIFSLTRGLFFKDNRLIGFSIYLEKELQVKCATLKGSNVIYGIEGDFIGDLTIGAEDTIFFKLGYQLLKDDKIRIKTTKQQMYLDLVHAFSSILSFTIGILVGFKKKIDHRIEFMRRYTIEILRFKDEFYNNMTQTFIKENLNIKENIVNTFSGRNFYSGKLLVEQKLRPGDIELFLNGQVIDICETIESIYNFLESWNKADKYPILKLVYEICILERNPSDILRFIDIKIRENKNR